MDASVLSCFSGAGGMDLGLEAAGFKIIDTIEFDETARRSLALNYPSSPTPKFDNVLEAAEELQPGTYGLRPGELGLVAGGPPCQPFSAAGQWAQTGRSGMADPRAGTVAAMLKLVESFRPKALLVENVIGFLQGSNSAGRTLTDGLNAINKRHGTNYLLNWSVVDSAEYGVPQHRRRAIAIAARDGTTVELPAPTHAPGSYVSAWDAIGDLGLEKLPESRGKWRDLLPLIPPGWNYQWLTSKGGGPELFGYRTRYWTFLLKLDPGRPSWTISASPGPSTGPFHWLNRPLAVPELLRLQGFPPTWKLAGKGHREKTKQIGNATPPILAEAVGRAVAEQLFGLTHADLKLAIPASAIPPPSPVTTASLPAQFVQQVGPKSAHAGHGRGPAPRTSALETDSP